MYGFAKRNLRYIAGQLDADDDGWPEGLGNVERPGMGPEKLDNAVYYVRGLYDLADLARSKGDSITYQWAKGLGDELLARFENEWWMENFALHADSLDDTNQKLQQKHWTTVTPMESELTIDGEASPGLASRGHGIRSLAAHEMTCFSGERPYNLGLFHTECAGGPNGAGERIIYSLTTAIQAVGEGNYGRLGAEQQRRYTDANVETMFGEPAAGGTPDEQPGAMPEIMPSPDFDGGGPRDWNIDRCWVCRAMSSKHGAATAPPGRSSTNSSACGPTSGAGSCRSYRSCPQTRRSPDRTSGSAPANSAWLPLHATGSDTGPPSTPRRHP